MKAGKNVFSCGIWSFPAKDLINSKLSDKGASHRPEASDSVIIVAELKLKSQDEVAYNQWLSLKSDSSLVIKSEYDALRVIFFAVIRFGNSDGLIEDVVRMVNEIGYMSSVSCISRVKSTKELYSFWNIYKDARQNSDR